MRWEAAVALVLVVEVRECQSCGSAFRSPGNLFVKLETQRGGYHRTWLMPHTEPQVNSFTLRRERRVVVTQVKVCENCFVTVPEDQLTFWPELFQPHEATAARLIRAEQQALRANKPKVEAPSKPEPRLEDL